MTHAGRGGERKPVGPEMREEIPVTRLDSIIENRGRRIEEQYENHCRPKYSRNGMALQENQTRSKVRSALNFIWALAEALTRSGESVGKMSDMGH
jgi:hypothetical protein